MLFSPPLALLRGTAKVGLAAAVALLAAAWPAQAQLSLTPAGTAANFSLSTFATGFSSSSSVGPLGMAFVGSTVLVSDYPGNVRVFATDIDNQSALAAAVAHNYGSAAAIGMAQVGGGIYMTQQSSGTGDLIQLNNDGTFKQNIVLGMPAATGIIANPHNGTLFVSTIGNDVIYTVDPVAKTKTVFLNNTEADGLSLSADGSVLYTASDNGHVYGFDTTSKLNVYDSGFIPGGIDGTAVGTGALAGNLFVNTNSGTVYEVNLLTNVQSQIASGGSRGDFVSVDPNNNTLLLTQTDSIIRLSPPPGGGFGGNPTPEPSAVATFALGALGLAGLLLRARRRAAKVSGV